jgi:hypothetical protein
LLVVEQPVLLLSLLVLTEKQVVHEYLNYHHRLLLLSHYLMV